jgi:hypothetical protein
MRGLSAMPQFDTSISVMGLVNAGVIVVVAYGGWKAFQSRVDILLANQKDLMDKLTDRFEMHEESDERIFLSIQDRITDLVGGVQRLIGQNDAFRKQPRTDR